MQTLHVELGERRYPIFIGSQLDPKQLLEPYIHGQQVMIVSNVTVAPLYLSHYQEALESLGKTVATCILPDGEKYKDIQHLNLIFDALLEAGFNRDCTVLALGGGVIGDMAGFASACFQRGVYFVQVPTTLLSQVDSSVGGKTGINHPLGKNMLGAFQQPQVVLADMAQLNTLPERELSAGLAEVIKYALLGDEDFLVWLEENMDGLVARDADLLAEAVYRSCAHKARIVANDEKEHGERALLNLGHTFGHAIESYLGYGTWLHGEAVATGMVMAADLSQRLGWISNEDVARTKKIIQRANLPISCPQIPLNDFLGYMAHDKKVLNGQLRLVLLKQLGQAVITKDFDVEFMKQAILANQHG
ncbi:3-dehydroquinate synthase [Acinetobacter baumannii]|uniref:3-dehydroquinate synthase n=3 Tax=Acinetobacter baumannii TaxID=470 RepID=A0A241ZAE4_ACIBA|nr:MULTISPECIES: 3-dehydroquinate synthase [Acinetobacter calcoaceticus/baumannii complex]EXB52943.1 3-dehydroquinate synthase [Acinetobacter baumannii 1440422]ANS20219.1 3-dehydroquinate synthase [Acinetobacter baumannii PR07]AUT38788.1 3-dehydroquinate synthase [Acinetobacter baumannii]AYX85642.1 3-dehydroquinate synthase [Acinetobacter baumannii]EHU3341896.1 3-dehydroquinate synthase [Acinetobacter baumannii]